MAKKNISEMSFLDHLEELRGHIFRCVAAVFVFAIIAFLNKSFVFDGVILAPKNPNFITYQFLCDLTPYLSKIGLNLCIEQIPYELKNIDMSGQFLSHIKISFIIGFCVAFPYIFWEFWRFVSPALHDTERKTISGAVFWASLLFFIGIFFGYFL